MPCADPPAGTDLSHLVQGVRLVLFDFDGVIADSEVLSLDILRAALADVGMSRSLEDVRRAYLGTSRDTVARDVAEFCGADRAPRFLAEWESTLFARFRRELRPVPGAKTLLDRLGALELPYAIASSGSLERISIALGAMDLSYRFAHVFSAEMVKHGKPAPDLFLHAARSMGIAPSATLVIEDSTVGITAARAAGMRCIGFVGGSHLTDLRDDHAAALRDAGADVILSDHAVLAAAWPRP